MRWVLGLALIAGCDYVLGIDQLVPGTRPVDAGMRDGQPGMISFVDDDADYPARDVDELDLMLSAVEAGDLELVFVTWVADGDVADVSDGEGALTSIAVAPEMQGDLRLATYYRANAPAQAPAVFKIHFSQMVHSADARVLQYRGVALQDALALDGTAVGRGSGDELTATVTTTRANDVVVGGTHCALACTHESGSERIRAELMSSGNFAAELTAGAPGPVTIIAGQTDVADWILQVVAFAPQ